MTRFHPLTRLCRPTRSAAAAAFLGVVVAFMTLTPMASAAAQRPLQVARQRAPVSHVRRPQPLPAKKTQQRIQVKKSTQAHSRPAPVIGGARGRSDFEAERGIGRVALSPYPTVPQAFRTHTTDDAWTAFDESFHAQIVKLAKMTSVPYVWGGGAINPRACASCRVCAAKTPEKDRLQLCPDCARCGMDCSHFVQHVFQNLGLEFPYATTADLIRLDAAALMSHYRLLDVGLDIARARPGDLLIYTNHVVILTQANSDGSGEIVHATAAGRNAPSRAGGIRWQRIPRLMHYRAPLKRILRHRRVDAQLVTRTSS